MNADFGVLRVNRAFSQISGYSAEEAQEAIAQFLASDRNPGAANSDFWTDALHLGVWKGEVRFKRKHGGYYMALVTFTVLTDIGALTFVETRYT